MAFGLTSHDIFSPLKKNILSKLLAGIILSLGGLILAFSALELYFRMTMPKGDIVEILRSSRNPRLVYELKPNMAVLDDGGLVKTPLVKVSTNSHGFRDREYPVKKADHIRRILVVGDSFTFGIGVESGQTFPKRLEDILNNQSSKKEKSKTRFDVINMGVFGYNTRQEVEFLKEKGIPFEPDIVIVTFIENDYYGIEKWDFSPFVRWVLKNSALCRAIFLKIHYIWILQQEAEANIRRGLKDILEALRELKVLSDRHHFKVILAFWMVPSYPAQWVRRECTILGFDMVDLWKYLDRIPPHEKSLPDNHPSAYSYSVVAGVLYTRIQNSYPELFLP